jgi:hypothetical protein
MNWISASGIIDISSSIRLCTAFAMNLVGMRPNTTKFTVRIDALIDVFGSKFRRIFVRPTAVVDID